MPTASSAPGASPLLRIFNAALRRDHPAAAGFWDAAPPSYRKAAAFWIADAKRPETRERRFAELVDACARGERLARFGTRPRAR